MISPPVPVLLLPPVPVKFPNPPAPTPLPPVPDPPAPLPFRAGALQPNAPAAAENRQTERSVRKLRYDINRLLLTASGGASPAILDSGPRSLTPTGYTEINPHGQWNDRRERAENRLLTLEITGTTPKSNGENEGARRRRSERTRRLAARPGADRIGRAHGGGRARNSAVAEEERPFAGGALAGDLADGVARPGATRVAGGRPPRE